MNIESIDVQQGKIQIKAGNSGSTTVAAKNITIGTADSAPKAGGTHLIDINGNSGSAVLGNADSKIALNSNGAIEFNGDKAATDAVLNGHIQASGGAIEFKQNGTFKAGGKTEGTNFKIYAGKTAVFDFDAALAKVENTDSHLKIDNSTVTIQGDNNKPRTQAICT